MMRTIISVICFLAALGIFFFYTRPAYDTVQASNAQIAQYDQALQKATELQQLKQTLLSRYNAFDPNNIDKLQKLLPDHVDNVRLILDLDSLAGRHGMALQNVAVSSSGSQSSPGQSASGAIGAAKQKYDSLTIKFTTQGSYDAFNSFLGDIDKSLRIVDLVALTLSNTTPGGTTIASSSAYTYDITLRTYWLK